MARACGLDFGTSNSTLGRVSDDGQPELVGLENGERTIPSVIFFGFEDDSLHFGREAVAEYVTGADGRLMRSLKSVLGSALMSDTTRVKARRYGFGEIIGLFVGELKQRAESAVGAELDTVVVGRPVQFVDDDAAADRVAQQQLEAAVRAQGFRHIEFQFEPIAAALDFERQVESEQLALVVDLGGGTSDFSLVRVSPERSRAVDRSADILATSGVHIGGTDFDRLLAMKTIMPELGLGSATADGKRLLPVAPYFDLSTWHRINRLYSAEALRDLRQTQREAADPDKAAMMVEIVEDRLGHRLIGEVEAAKIGLSNAPGVSFAFAVRDAVLRRPIALGDFADAIAAQVERIEVTINGTLAGAGVTRDAVDSLILTGGSTQVPAVAAMLTAAFPEARIVRTDVLGSVGLGLALEAKRRFGNG